MKKIIDFFKERYLICILVLLVIIIFLVVIINANKKGTFGLETPSITLECPAEAKAGSTINCDIKLVPAGQKILSVNANYDFANEVSYKSFTAKNDFELYSVDEDGTPSVNGFAIGNIDGVTADTVVGTLSVTIAANASVNENYKVGLKTVELSNDQFEMVEPASATVSDNVKVTDNSGGTDTDGLEINDLIVDDGADLIKRLTVGMTYAELKTHFVTNAVITITSNDGKQITDGDVVKTGDTVTFALTGGNVTYTLSVLGDNSGDGVIEVNDVGRLYKYYNHRLEFNNAQIESGDVNNDGTIEINDVGRLYKFYNNKIPTLEVGGN